MAGNSAGTFRGLATSTARVRRVAFPGTRRTQFPLQRAVFCHSLSRFCVICPTEESALVPGSIT
jgi:hypothetical protein